MGVLPGCANIKRPGRLWTILSNRTITWTHNYSATQTFDIDFSSDAGTTWTQLVSSVPAASATTESYAAVMPNILTSQALIRVAAVGTTLDRERDTSDVTFTLRPARLLR